MSTTDFQENAGGETEAALLDAELFIKYQAPERALKRLQSAVDKQPGSIILRERLREVAATYKHPQIAARQCLALANLYIAREDLDHAHERLLEAKGLDARISIVSGLEAIRRARHPQLQQNSPSTEETTTAPQPHQAARATTMLLGGNLAAVSIFDAMQTIENARLTGTLLITGGAQTGRILINEGRIVGAETAAANGLEAFRQLIEVTVGFFEFQQSTESFPVQITAATNTNLILDALRQLDEEKK